jgi:hypothetical protein
MLVAWYRCYCGAPTCKGVIGTEGDVVKDESSKGIFREPTIEEIGTAIIDRRIRIFKSPEEQSVYSVAIVIGYEHCHMLMIQAQQFRNADTVYPQIRRGKRQV